MDHSGGGLARTSAPDIADSDLVEGKLSGSIRL